jgi:GDPmannose 4,6-dehydratase
VTVPGSCDALVIGASGQDGPYLLAAARARGLRALGTSRSGTDGALKLDPCDAGAVASLLDKLRPERIFLLAGQSSVQRSYECPAETFRSHTQPLLACAEWMRTSRNRTRLIYAASGECFGPRSAEDPAREGDAFAPANPYATAKTAAALLVRQYRRDYSLHIANAFLFNHESPRRGPQFVFGKLLAGLRAIRAGERDEPVRLGDLSARRDWGWAPDYCAAMLKMSDLSEPEDLILATGKTVALAEAVAAIVAASGLDLDRCVSSTHHGDGNVDAQYADPARATERIGWQGSTPFPALARKLVEASE